MTALKPTDDRHVVPVAATRYILNTICGHPDCTKPAESAHHIWPRSFLKGDSWFVKIDDEGASKTFEDGYGRNGGVLAHVIGLCGSGTTGHHGDLEEHRAWIRLEEDGVFVWYKQRAHYDKEGKPYTFSRVDPDMDIYWDLVGPLSPQPGSRESKPKRRKKASTAAERKARKVYSIRTPEGEENVLPELMEFAQEAFQKALSAQELPLPYVTAVAALSEFIKAHGKK